MKARDWVIVFAVAAATAAVVAGPLAYLPGLPVNAQAAEGATPAKLTVTSDGVQFTLTPPRLPFNADDKPVVLVEAANGTASPAVAKVAIRMMSTAQASALRRVLPVPEEVWSHEISVRLGPKETKTVEVPIEADAKEGALTYFQIGTGGDRAPWVGSPLSLKLLAAEQVQ